ncbi:MAG: PAS domain-containing protein [Sporomusaceae bacterium]|nr:PAS domain-containing protein [Sporomusaceae bacterium]
MNDQHKSKEQLIEELAELRQQLAKLKAGEDDDFKMLVENSPDVIIRFNQSMGVLFANSLAIKVVGMPSATYVGKTLKELNLKDNYSKLLESHIKKVIINKQRSIFEAEFINYKGQHFHYQARLVPEFDKNGLIESVLLTAHNISELKKALLALRASEKRNNVLLAAFPDLLIYLSNEGIYLDFHATRPSLVYTNIKGRLGKHLSEVLPPDQAQKIMDGIRLTIASGQMQVVEYQLQVNNVMCFFEGRIIKFNADSVLIIVRNISELTRLKQGLTRLDQLHLVGEMAASIGHEVRNPMTTVRGFLQLFARKPEFIKYSEHLNLMIEELDRANGIISEFLSLAKNKSLKLERQNLNTIINTMAPLIHSHATMSNKYLELDLEPVTDLLLDAQEIRQLIFNLVNNALEAMLPDGMVTIRTFIENNQVIMAIKDTGTGIPLEIMEKLGIPFFTTKDEGTGLGLAICYTIAARHNAAVEVSTSPSGTTFFIRFDQQ